MTPEERVNAAVVACAAMADPFSHGVRACSRHVADQIRAAEADARRTLEIGYDARAVTIKGYEEEIEKLIREKDDLRASLTTAEKEIAEWKERALGHARSLRATEDRLAAVEEALTECGYDDHDARVAAINALEVTATTSVADAAPAANKASDSSALEKALGALRAAREWVKQASYSALGARNLLIEIDAILSGGAHVDGPKAEKEEVK